MDDCGQKAREKKFLANVRRSVPLDLTVFKVVPQSHGGSDSLSDVAVDAESQTTGNIHSTREPCEERAWILRSSACMTLLFFVVESCHAGKCDFAPLEAFWCLLLI